MEIIDEESICLHVSDVGIIRIDDPLKVFAIRKSDWITKNGLFSLTIPFDEHGFNYPFVAGVLLLRDGIYYNSIPEYIAYENKDLELLGDESFDGKIIVKGEIFNA